MLGAPFMDPAGQLRTEVQGLLGGAYVLEAGDTLGQWAPSGEVRFQDYNQSAEFAAPIGDADRKFIRLSTPAP